MSTILQDKAFFRTGVQELEDYLLSNEMFWPLSKGKGLPRLTLGALLLAEKRLGAYVSSTNDIAAVNRLELQLESIRAKWRVAWQRKAAREVHTRFDQWKNFLEDYRQSPDVQAGEYPEEVQSRVMLHLLGKELSNSPSEFMALKDLDKFLKDCLISGPFIWARELAPAFPADEYWFLYGKLKSSS
jgi:hypothetical protein